ncbi:hypothetical protein [Demequina sp. NBRC 110053]|uniref:hypothetical protein n=1 Tax=Demequina sp. NBRC 110053 TaxID=1570342 RepID=UPI000A003A71|nr:hypothetical protein [Demequina sp. NBRC 110053]
MTDHAHHDDKPRDDDAVTDQDKPIALDNADSHRPDSAGGPNLQSPPKEPVSAEGRVAKGGNQNPDAKQPPDSQIHKQQRSQGMNHSGWEGQG